MFTHIERTCKIIGVLWTLIIKTTAPKLRESTVLSNAGKCNKSPSDVLICLYVNNSEVSYEKLDYCKFKQTELNVSICLNQYFPLHVRACRWIILLSLETQVQKWMPATHTSFQGALVVKESQWPKWHPDIQCRTQGENQTDRQMLFIIDPFDQRVQLTLPTWGDHTPFIFLIFIFLTFLPFALVHKDHVENQAGVERHRAWGQGENFCSEH